VDHERVADGAGRLASRALQHARSVDRDMAPRIAHDPKDGRSVGWDFPLDLESFAHGRDHDTTRRDRPNPVNQPTSHATAP
jgi:hypothetical protein